MLANARWEKFCQAIVSGGHASHGDAYIAAGYHCKPEMADRCAYILMRKSPIMARIAELRVVEEAAIAKLVEKVSLTREWVLDELVDNVKKAKEGEKFDGATANRALELLGKQLGMFVDRQENTNTIYGISDKPMTPEEWIKQYAGAPADKAKH
jgi:hypothetical protein